MSWGTHPGEEECTPKLGGEVQQARGRVEGRAPQQRQSCGGGVCTSWGCVRTLGTRRGGWGEEKDALIIQFPALSQAHCTILILRESLNPSIVHFPVCEMGITDIPFFPTLISPVYFKCKLLRAGAVSHAHEFDLHIE